MVQKAAIQKKFKPQVKPAEDAYFAELKRIRELPGGKEAIKLLEPDEPMPKPTAGFTLM
jgi:hypothetical protein